MHMAGLHCPVQHACAAPVSKAGLHIGIAGSKEVQVSCSCLTAPRSLRMAQQEKMQAPLLLPKQHMGPHLNISCWSDVTVVIRGESCQHDPGVPVQVMLVRRNGSIVLAGVDDAPPAYSRMVDLLRSVKGSKTSQTWVNRVFPSKRFGKISWQTHPFHAETALMRQLSQRQRR